MGFGGYLVRRLLLVVPTLAGVTVISFALTNLLPGNPALVKAGALATPEVVQEIERQMGLDRPLPVQYLSFMRDVVRGDFGRSFYYRTPVLELYLSRLPNSLVLALTAMAFSLILGIPTGILAAVRVGGWWDSAGKVFALLGLSMPSFWTGLLLILFFSV
ncbi:MAG TPA: ABC transporter permease, partial [Methylomirabilota bacterium]